MKIIKTVILAVSVATMAFASSRAEEANAERRNAREAAAKMTMEERKHKLEELKLAIQNQRKPIVGKIVKDNFVDSKFFRRLKDGNLSPSTPLKEWVANSSTNDVCVMVCTDSVQYKLESAVLAFREFRFSSDGRLLSISPVKEIRQDGWNPAHNHE
jgi:hypothetical protein